MYKALLLLFFLTSNFGFLQAQVNEVIPPDYIKTIQFKGSSNQDQLPIITLGGNLSLSFDALNGEEADFYYKISHYNFDWTPSELSKNEYMEGFDDVRIYTYENSLNTLQIFSHYTLNIPNRDTRKLTKSGNYMIEIFDYDNEIVFSRKFMVIEKIANVGVEIKRAREIKYINSKQVVQFKISSPNLQITNPKQNIKVLVIKNNNLKNAITNLRPQYILGNELIYKYDTEASFWGGNEYLFFDNKDVKAANNSIRKVALTDIYENYLYTNGPRKDRPYTYNPDINGNFVIRNISAKNQDIEAEYVRLHFALQYFEDIGDKELHIYGNFNNYTIDESTFLEYDSFSDTYKTTRLFKQGFYNYKYVLVDRDGSIDEGAISGNFWQTENIYDVIVYYRDLGARYDRIIGRGQASSININNN